MVGRLDTRYQGSETDAVGESPDSDPMMNGIGSAYVAGFQQYLRQEFGSQLPERPYRFSGNGVFGKWKRSESDQAAFAGWLDTVPALADTMQEESPAARVLRQWLVRCGHDRPGGRVQPVSALGSTPSEW